MVSNVFFSILNSYNKFFAFAFSPVIVSLCMILTIIFVNGTLREKSYYIVLSYVFGGFCQMLFTIHQVVRNKIKLISSPKKYDFNQVRKFFQKLLPSCFISSMTQINFFLFSMFFSFQEGKISILAYGERCYRIPIAIISMAFTIVLLPVLSNLTLKKDIKKINNIQNKIIKIVLFLSTPLSLVIIFFSKYIIHICFERGIFTYNSTLELSQVLTILTLSLPANSIVKILSNIFYVNNIVKKLFYINFFTLMINIILNLVLIFVFRVGFLSIPINSTICMWLQLIIIITYLHSKKYFFFQKSIVSWTFYIILSSFISIGFMSLFIKFIFSFKYSYLSKLFILLSSGFLGVIVYLFSSLFFNQIKFANKKISIHAN